MKLQKTKRTSHLLALGLALMFVLTMYPAKAHAQTMRELEVNIPFEFQAGNSKLPAGKYVIHALDDSDPTIMAISSADGTVTAFFNVQSDKANAVPAQSELIFNKYGNRYFLAQLFEKGDQNGSKVVESRDEKRISRAAEEGQEHLRASDRG